MFVKENPDRKKKKRNSRYSIINDSFFSETLAFFECNAYLRTRHQSFILKLIAFKSLGLKFSENPGTAANFFPESLESFLESISTESIAYSV